MLPLAMLWLAVHAALLAAFLSLKFLTAKIVMLGLLLFLAMTFVFRAGSRRVPRRLTA